MNASIRIEAVRKKYAPNRWLFDTTTCRMALQVLDQRESAVGSGGAAPLMLSVNTMPDTHVE